jgi:prophage antirepressor-like protein
MQLFSQQIGEQSVAISATLVGDVPWFRGNDVATALGYKNVQQAIRAHVHEEDRQTLNNLEVRETRFPIERNEGAQVFITESGVYSLIMRSKKTEAKLFQRWVTNEVLPSIRRTGQYNQPRMDSGARGVEDGHAHRPSPYEQEMVRSARMQALTAAYTAAQTIGSTSQPRLQTELQKAIDALLLPQGDAPDQYIDAEAILRERGHNDEQIARLAGELGKDLKQLAQKEERDGMSREGQFGAERHQVGLYHRVRDAPLIEAALNSFKRRDLYPRVMEGRPDPIRARREAFLDSSGRGRSRSQRQR